MFCPKCGKDNDPSFRYCSSCGTFIPDISSPEFSNGQTQAQPNPAQPNPAQPMYPQGAGQDNFYNQTPVLSADQMNEINNDQSRYQEYTMSDVVAKKSHKKLIIWLIVIAGVIALGIATFFIVRAILSSMALGKIKDDPTKYVADSYRTTAASLAGNNKLTKTFADSSTKQKTTRLTVTNDYSTNMTLFSVDGVNNKFYVKQNIKYSPDFGEDYTDATGEFYSTLDRGVIKAEYNNGKSFDYYLDYEGLRENALNSAFGPEGENILNINRTQYDTFMDVYEYVFKNLKAEDPFGLEAFGKTLCEDFDKCGNVSVSEEKADIDGTQTDAYVITHTFENTDIITTVYGHFTDWVRSNVNINGQINLAIDEALSKVDLQQLLSSANGLGGVKVTLKHYTNKNGALMQAEFIVEANGQTMKLVMTYGADPENSKKITVKALTGSNGNDVTVQSAVLTDESDSSVDKYVITYSGLLVTGSTTFVRDTGTGDFTLSNNMSSPMSSYGSSGTQLTAVGGESATPNFTVTGNLQITDDSMTLTYKDTRYGTNTTYEYYVSTKAEIVELTSDNNILTASAADLKKLIGASDSYDTPEVQVLR